MTLTTPTATHVAYYHLCHRKLWLAWHGIRLENVTDNTYVETGKLISQTTYARRPQKWRELSLPGIKIDHFDPTTNTVREVKKSRKLEKAHVAQVQYYLYRLEEAGIKCPQGIIEYPKQKKTMPVPWNEQARQAVKNWLVGIQEVIDREKCPDVIRKAYCRTCAFRDFCYV